MGKIDRRYSHQVPAGTWSDDGSLMLALLDSLLSPGADGLVPRVDLADQGARFRAWYEDGTYTLRRHLLRHRQHHPRCPRSIACGVSPAESGPGEYSQGNGALMRILERTVEGSGESFINSVPHLHHTIGNLKAWLIGTHKGVGRHHQSGLPRRVRLPPEPPAEPRRRLPDAPWPHR